MAADQRLVLRSTSNRGFPDALWRWRLSVGSQFGLSIKCDVRRFGFLWFLFFFFFLFFLVYSHRWRCVTDTDWRKSKMEEICASIFGPDSLSSHRERSNFICGPAEKSAVLTVATLLARNVFHIGGTVAVPQRCRLTQIGELNSVCFVFAFLSQEKGKAYWIHPPAAAIYNAGWRPELMFMY